MHTSPRFPRTYTTPTPHIISLAKLMTPVVGFSQLSSVNLMCFTQGKRRHLTILLPITTIFVDISLTPFVLCCMTRLVHIDPASSSYNCQARLLTTGTVPQGSLQGASHTHTSTHTHIYTHTMKLEQRTWLKRGG